MLSRAARADRGSVAVFTAVFAVAVIFLLGLLVDGGSTLDARERAADMAEQAARAAATDLDPASLRGPTPSIDWGSACGYADQVVASYASQYSDMTKPEASCVPGDGPLSVTVTVSFTVRPAIPVPGFSSVPVTATQSATAECGNADQQEAC